MKDLQKLYEQGREIVIDSCGDILGEITKIEPERRKKKSWATCTLHHDTNTYTIGVSKRILEDSVPDYKTLSVIVHELLHTCKDSIDHGTVWKKNARKVMEKYPELTVTRTYPYTFFGFSVEEQIKNTPYVFQCVGCGVYSWHFGKSKMVKDPARFRCVKCGGGFKRIK